MGLSSSQARLLHITARMHQIEYKAQKLEAQKLQLANESDRVYNEYLEALDATKVQYKSLNSDGSITFIDATYDALINQGYQIIISDMGQPLSGSETDNFIIATKNKTEFEVGNRNYFIALCSGHVTSENPYKPKDTTNADSTTGEAESANNNKPVKMATAMAGTVTEIYTQEQFVNYLEQEEHGSVRLMCDIDASELKPQLKNKDSNDRYNALINNLSGTFDGNGHTISNLNYSLINKLNGGATNLKISGNVKCEDNNIIYQNNECNVVGLLACYVIGNGSTVSNVEAYGSVEGSYSENYANNKAFTGGLIGLVESATVANCSFSGEVTGNIDCGGLIGRAASSDVTKCIATGVVTSKVQAGGLIGHISYTNVSNSMSDVTINVKKENYSTNVNSGGFIGHANGECNISYCKANGELNDSSGVIGDQTICSGFLGFVGNGGNVTINNCETIVDVKSINSIVCDFATVYADQNNSSLTIDHCNALGSSSTGVSNGYLNFAHVDGGNTLKVSNYYSNQVDAKCTSNGGTINQGMDPPNKLDKATPIKVGDRGANVEEKTHLGEENILKYGALFDSAVKSGYFDYGKNDPYNISTHKNDYRWLTNMIVNGFAYIKKLNKETGTYDDVSVATDTGLREISDEKNLKKAEAKYESDMRQIEKKDRKYDTDLAELETERSACKEEIQTLSTVAKENVDRTFKLFS